jgi:starch-binding outer membrane protein, SusD/RagB family
MKKIIVSFLILTTIIPGCKKFLDEKPQTEIGDNEFWKSEDDIKAGLAAMYDGVQSMFDNDYTLWGDSRTDEVEVNQYGDDAYSVNGLSAATRGSDWTNIYKTIARANLAIKNIPIIKDTYQTGLDPKLVNHYLAEAYGTRAFCYFWIVRLWGDAPIYKEPFESLTEEPKSRTAANIVIDSVIIPDLIKAAALSDVKRTDVYEVSLGAIYSMLMDVAMWKKDYTKAVEWFDKLEGLKKYSLEPTATWKKVFIDPTTSKESIWSVNWDWTVDGGADASTLIGAGNTNSDFYAEDSVWNYFTTTTADIRGPQTIDFDVPNHDKFLKYYPVELNSSGNQIYPNGSQANILFPLYRLADLYLLRAEAANQLDDPANALKYLNLVHERAGLTAYTALSFLDKTSMENGILEERKLEFFMEAKRWFDLVRTGKVIEVMDPYIKRRQEVRGTTPTGFGDPRTILWPLNRTVLNSNANLIQNPPY